MQYAHLFGIGSAVEQGEGQDGDDTTEQQDTTFAQKWGWVDNVAQVSNTIHSSWDDVWRMNVVEFLNIMCYIRDKAEKEKEDIERWRRTH